MRSSPNQTTLAYRLNATMVVKTQHLFAQAAVHIPQRKGICSDDLFISLKELDELRMALLKISFVLILETRQALNPRAPSLHLLPL